VVEPANERSPEQRLAEALEQEPGDLAACRALARLLLERGQPGLARGVVLRTQAACEQLPDDADAELKRLLGRAEQAASRLPGSVHQTSAAGPGPRHALTVIFSCLGLTLVTSLGAGLPALIPFARVRLELRAKRAALADPAPAVRLESARILKLYVNPPRYGYAYSRRGDRHQRRGYQALDGEARLELRDELLRSLEPASLPEAEAIEALEILSSCLFEPSSHWGDYRSALFAAHAQALRHDAGAVRRAAARGLYELTGGKLSSDVRLPPAEAGAVIAAYEREPALRPELLRVIAAPLRASKRRVTVRWDWRAGELPLPRAPDPSLDPGGAWSLWLGKPALVIDLVLRAFESDDPRLRAAALSEISVIGAIELDGKHTPRVEAMIRAGLASGTSGVRADAEQAGLWLRTRVAAEAALQGVRGHTRKPRKLDAMILGRYGTQQVRTWLVDAQNQRERALLRDALPHAERFERREREGR